MNSERGFATNILYGPPAVDPQYSARSSTIKCARTTDGARDKMNAIRKNLSGGLDDAAAIGAGIDDLNAKFNALREAMDKAIDGPAEARKDAARKIVADNAVFNAAATKLLDEQVRRMAQLDGDAYRQADLCQHRLEPARRRRLQRQHPQEPRRRQARRHRSRKDGVFAARRAAPTRS